MDILGYIRNRGGYITRKELKTHYQYEQILKYIKTGDILRIKNGVYCLPDYEIDAIDDLSILIPDGILCMWSAWSYYDMCDLIPDGFCVAIESSRRVRLPNCTQIKLYYRKDKLLNLGKTVVERNGIQTLIYDKERCVCDAIKYEMSIGIDESSKILRSYLNGGDVDYNKLMDYAKQLRVDKKLFKIINYIL